MPVVRGINDDFACFINISIGAVFFSSQLPDHRRRVLPPQTAKESQPRRFDSQSLCRFYPNCRQAFGKRLYSVINEGDNGFAFPINGTIAKAVFRISAN